MDKGRIKRNRNEGRIVHNMDRGRIIRIGRRVESMSMEKDRIYNHTIKSRTISMGKKVPITRTRARLELYAQGQGRSMRTGNYRRETWRNGVMPSSIAGHFPSYDPCKSSNYHVNVHDKDHIHFKPYSLNSLHYPSNRPRLSSPIPTIPIQGINSKHLRGVLPTLAGRGNHQSEAHKPSNTRLQASYSNCIDHPNNLPLTTVVGSHRKLPKTGILTISSQNLKF